jgi:hypothetical protein
MPENAALSCSWLIHPWQKVCVFWRSMTGKRIESHLCAISQESVSESQTRRSVMFSSLQEYRP